MSLTPGTRIGPYEVIAQIGVGGMGEVYRATDTKLKRQVAIKVLPESLAADPDRLARFQREAEVLASLNHPNIAAIHGLEESDGIKALVMELVEGPTLADRIAHGAIPLDEALSIAKQIAEALEVAHEQGIIHRDLKPANIKVRPDGAVKVLDFGLAKAMAPTASSAASSAHLSMSPTITSPAMMTGVGMILGTAAYMSPEQAKGLGATYRSDVFSFGSVLYEMLTGRQAFSGENVHEILASVLARQPDLTALPPHLSSRFMELLRRCFEKDPRRRWQAVGDLRVELETVSGAPWHQEVSDAARVRPPWRRVVAPLIGVATSAVVLGIGATIYLRPLGTVPIVTRFSLAPLPGGIQFNFGNPSFAISPDGTKVTYSTSAGLYVRSLSEFDGTLILPASPIVSVVNPIFSPDGQSIAFASEGVLRRIPAGGGTPFTICPLPPGFGNGLGWDGDDILFGGASGLRRVTPSGGVPEVLLPLKPGEWGWSPHALPGGEWVLFTVARGLAPEDWDSAQIVAQSVLSRERRVLVENGRDARYVVTGHLVFARGGVLFAAPFDAQRVTLSGPALPVIDGIRRSAVNGTSHFSISKTGSLVYMPGPTGFGERRVEMVVADRNGTVQRTLLPPGPYDHPRVSPNGKLLAFGTTGQDQNVWTYDLSGSGAPRRLTFSGKNKFPIWSADGQRILFQSDREGGLAIYWQIADGSGTPERLTRPDPGTAHIPDTWLPGQERFLFSIVKESMRTLWTFSVQGNSAEPFDKIQAAMPRGAAVSPDGKWLAYVASPVVSGTTQGVFVQPIPPTGATYQISERNTGQQPLWSLDGREIIFVPGGGQLAAVHIESGPGFAFSKPTALRRAFTENLAPAYERNYDMTRDGKFIGLAAPGQNQSLVPTGQINVVLNWFDELKRLVPTK